MSATNQLTKSFRFDEVDDRTLFLSEVFINFLKGLLANMTGSKLYRLIVAWEPDNDKLAHTDMRTVYINVAHPYCQHYKKQRQRFLFVVACLFHETGHLLDADLTKDYQRTIANIKLGKPFCKLPDILTDEEKELVKALQDPALIPLFAKYGKKAYNIGLDAHDETAMANNFASYVSQCFALQLQVHIANMPTLEQMRESNCSELFVIMALIFQYIRFGFFILLEPEKAVNDTAYVFVEKNRAILDDLRYADVPFARQFALFQLFLAMLPLFKERLSPDPPPMAMPMPPMDDDFNGNPERGNGGGGSRGSSSGSEDDDTNGGNNSGSGDYSNNTSGSQNEDDNGETGSDSEEDDGQTRRFQVRFGDEDGDDDEPIGTPDASDDTDGDDGSNKNSSGDTGGQDNSSETGDGFPGSKNSSDENKGQGNAPISGGGSDENSGEDAPSSRADSMKPGSGKPDDDNSGDGSTDNGSAEGGITNDGKSNDGKSNDGKSDNGESDNGESDNGKPDNGKSDSRKSNNGKADNGKADDGKSDNGKQDDGNPDNGKSDNGKPDNRKPDDGKSDSGEHDNVKGDDREWLPDPRKLQELLKEIDDAGNYFGDDEPENIDGKSIKVGGDRRPIKESSAGEKAIDALSDAFSSEVTKQFLNADNDAQNRNSADKEVSEIVVNQNANSPHSRIPVRIIRPSYSVETVRGPYNILLSKVGGYASRIAQEVKMMFEEIREGTTLHCRRSGHVDSRGLSRMNTNQKIFFTKKAPSDEDDMAIFFLIDQSDSMSSANEGEGASKIAYSREVAVMLEHFARLAGIPLYIAGHNMSDGGMNFYIHKSFESKEELDRCSLAAIGTSGRNRDGLAIHISCEILGKRPEQDKLFIILSDGLPNDGGYGGKAAAEDIQNIVRLAQRKYGIETIACAIGKDRDRIRDIYGNAYLDVSDFSALPKKLTQLIRERIE